MSGSGLFDGAPIIHSYTRSQALEDGTLVDLTAWARETGFTIPVACTRAVWEDCVAWTDDDRDAKPATFQDERGRAHDVLWMLFVAIRRANAAADRVEYSLLRVPREGDGHLAELVTLYAVCGPGDDAEPVITVMARGED